MAQIINASAQTVGEVFAESVAALYTSPAGKGPRTLLVEIREDESIPDALERFFWDENPEDAGMRFRPPCERV